MKSLSILIIFCTMIFGPLARGGNEMTTAKEIIEKLGLQPLPHEGGYYRETYKSDETTKPCDSNLTRSLSTAIYYLVTPDSFSALHRVKSDEMFHFYSGDAVEMIQITDDGKLSRITLGSDVLRGESPQVVVPKGVWQALRLKKGGRWALMGTTVSPGFEFEDFELGNREKMNGLFPRLEDDINGYTRE